MKYFITGLLLGAALQFFILLPGHSIEFYPHFYSPIKGVGDIQAASVKKGQDEGLFSVKTGSMFSLLGVSGKVLVSKNLDNKQFSFSGNGKFFVEYEKVGKEIEYKDIWGKRYWKLKSLEYPYLSKQGKIVLLLNGDQSRIRVFDNNGNPLPGGTVHGRLCTSITFSAEEDTAAAGFIDGNYYIIDSRGNIFKGKVPEKGSVKTIALSPRGLFAAVHFGGGKRDGVVVVDNTAKETNFSLFTAAHVMKTGLHVNDRGTVLFLDRERVVFLDKEAEVCSTISIPPAAPGFASIDSYRDLYALAYPGKDGYTRFFLMKENGSFYYTREFKPESYLAMRMVKGFIYLQGSDNLYCYKLFL